MNSADPRLEQRYEVKIPIVGIALYQVKRWILCHPSFFKVLHPQRQVNNIYFDTYDHYAFQSHVDGYAERIKYRLRWYGDANQFTASQLELKIKQGEVGNKQQYFIDEQIDLANQNWREIKKKIINNIPPYPGELIATKRPVLINCYQREYFQSLDQNIRLTLDYNVKYLDQQLFTRPNLHHYSPTETMIVLELKAGIKHYKEIVETVSSFPIRGGAVSKFINGVSSALGA